MRKIKEKRKQNNYFDWKGAIFGENKKEKQNIN